MITICVDAMGGDESPELVCEGIAAALDADPELCVLVAGNAEYVEPFCAAHSRAKALVTTEVIEMGDHPAEAVRSKRDSSIVRGCAAVRVGEADGFFSAGSTGAIFAAAATNVGKIRGIKRPAIASTLPGMSGRETLLLDLCANADCRPEMIVQFAQMGAAYARTFMGVAEPRVALLSNGTEETKGSEQALAFHAALAEAVPEFVGNCEGVDILAGTYDVIVCDGFTGNVALKSLEGTAKFLVSRIKAAANASLKTKIGAGLMVGALRSIAGELSGDVKGGAVLLGLKAPVFIGHGSTSVDAIKNGTLAVAAAVRGDLTGRIAETLAK